MKNIRIRETRSIGDRFPATFEYFFAELKGFFVPFLIYAAPLLLVVLGYSTYVSTSIMETVLEEGSAEDWEEMSKLLAESGFSTMDMIMILILSIVASVLTMSIFGSYMRLREELQDSRPGPGEVFRHALPRMLPMALLLILSGIAFSLGFMVFLIGGLIVGVLFAAAYPAIFMEDLSAIESIQRSFHLCKKNFFNTLGFFFILIITVVFTFFILSFLLQPISALGMSMMEGMPILGVIILGIAGIINQLINGLIYIGQFLHYGHLSEKEDNHSFENEINAL
ncbi:MAG TPA: hypothetical protein VJ917_03590 [Saprospiraceae bacterium]|nr:hypothetical protein [Saprospiraceae bacterium]